MKFLKVEKCPIEQGYEVNLLLLNCSDTIFTEEVDGMEIKLDAIENMNIKSVVVIFDLEDWET